MQLREMAQNLWTHCNTLYISPSFKNNFPNGKYNLHGQCGKFIKHKKVYRNERKKSYLTPQRYNFLKKFLLVFFIYF